jgi:hypothetical protein
MIEILRYKPINKGAMLGFFDCYIEKFGLEIFGCSLYEKDGRRWVNFPAKPYEEEGQKKFSPDLRFRRREHAEAFSEACKKALDHFLEAQRAMGEKKEEAFEDLPF